MRAHPYSPTTIMARLAYIGTCNRISDEVSYPSTARLDYDGAVETPALAFARIATFSAVSANGPFGQAGR
jgi:hypothetical protein